MSSEYQGKLTFPSPYGEVGFDPNKMKKFEFESYTFPSPYGEVGFDRMTSAIIALDDMHNVSVPLRGSWF